MKLNLKFKSLIEKGKLTIECPCSVKEVDNIYAVRFVFDPISHEDNFLPNIIFDERRGFNTTRLVPEKYCKRCGISLFDSVKNAKLAYRQLSPKIRKNLGYTHLAEGILMSHDGWMMDVDNGGHFCFYEMENVNLFERFNIIESL